MLTLAACAAGDVEHDGLKVFYTVSLADGTALDEAEAVTVMFLSSERITDGFPPVAGNVWIQEPLGIIDATAESSQRLTGFTYRDTRWRGYARLVPPRGDEPPIVGDIVDPVLDEDRCDGDVCYRMNAHFELGRVTVP